MSSVFRGLRAVRGAQLQTRLPIHRPTVSQFVKPVRAPVANMSSNSVKATARTVMSAAPKSTSVTTSVIQRLGRTFAIPKPYPFTTSLLQAGMPQLVPFYFINQVTYAFILLTAMIYIMSKYILPRFVRLFLTRTFITKI